MMTYQFHGLSILFLVGFGVTAGNTCPENEVFKYHPSCSRTCQNEEPQACNDQYVEKCDCIDGYIREGPGGLCVPSCKNVSICSTNEIFGTCISPCEPICDERYPTACTQDCVKGCRCRNGFIREQEGGGCVSESTCQPLCGENERYGSCRGCVGTCSRPIQPCPRICIAGCSCKEDYLEDDNTGKCIYKDDCPKICTTEVY